MLISYATDISNVGVGVSNGYGYAGKQIIESLERLGHRVVWREPSAAVELWFCQPEYWQWSNPDAYKIGYVPWESTEIPQMWIEPMKTADEIWTTSEWCKSVFESHGMTNVKVYSHGIDDMWTPSLRRGKNTIKFLHVGEPAERKAGQLTFNTFRDIFGDQKDVSLTIKAHNFSTVRNKDRKGSIISNVHDLANVNVITKDIAQEQMMALYRQHDVLVYPSWGEGFGFIPLQALATGMPVICTGAWAPYRKFLGDLELDSRLVDSPWPQLHPGQMFEPDAAHLADCMRAAYNYFPFLAQEYYDQADQVRAQFSWDRHTRKAFAPIVERFG